MKVTGNRRVFPNDESVIKLVGLVSMQIERRWAKSKVRGCILNKRRKGSSR